jgi:hypothetical protein
LKYKSLKLLRRVVGWLGRQLLEEEGWLEMTFERIIFERISFEQ